MRLTQPLAKYIPEWYHLKKSSSGYFKKQSWFFMTRFYKNIGWSTFKNAQNRYLYFLKGEQWYAAERSKQRLDINRARIAAACEEHGFKYHYLASTLKKIDVHLNTSALARLAIYEPQTFKSIVDIAKEASSEPLRPVNFNPNHLESQKTFQNQ